MVARMDFLRTILLVLVVALMEMVNDATAANSSGKFSLNSYIFLFNQIFGINVAKLVKDGLKIVRYRSKLSIRIPKMKDGEYRI